MPWPRVLTPPTRLNPPLPGRTAPIQRQRSPRSDRASTATSEPTVQAQAAAEAVPRTRHSRTTLGRCSTRRVVPTPAVPATTLHPQAGHQVSSIAFRATNPPGNGNGRPLPNTFRKSSSQRHPASTPKTPSQNYLAQTPPSQRPPAHRRLRLQPPLQIAACRNTPPCTRMPA